MPSGQAMALVVAALAAARLAARRAVPGQRGGQASAGRTQKVGRNQAGFALGQMQPLGHGRRDGARLKRPMPTAAAMAMSPPVAAAADGSGALT